MPSIGLGEASALLAAVTWATTSLIVRSQAGRVDPLLVNAVRSTVAALLMLALLPIALSLGASPALPPGAVLLLILSILAGLGIGDTLYFESLRLLGVARALPLTSSYPLFTTALAVLFLDEPITVQLAGGVVLTVAGVALVATPGGATAATPTPARGVAIALLAALFWAASTVTLRPVLAQMDLFLANAIRLPVAALALWLFALRRPGRWPRKLDPETLRGLGLAGLTTALSSIAFLAGVHLAGGARAAALSSTSPLFALPAGLLVGERPTARVALGTLLGVVGIVLLVGG